MINLTKVITCILLCFSLVIGLGVTSFADTVDNLDYYSTSQSITSFNSAFYVTDDVGEKSLGYCSYDLNHTIPSGTSGQTILEDTTTRYTPVWLGEEITLKFSKSTTPTTDRAFFYYTPALPGTDIGGYTLAETRSDLFVYDQSKTQGELRLRTSWTSLNALDSTFDGMDVYAVYSGVLYYPILGGGGYERVPFVVGTNVREAVIRPFNTASFDIRASIVPCSLASYNTFDKINLYQYVYSQAPDDVKLKLRSPSELADETCVIEDYTARLTCSYYIEVAGGSALITPGRRFAYNGLTSDNIDSLVTTLPRCTRVGYSMPITLKGTPRQGETLSEFLDTIVLRHSTVDISDFDWFVFVRNTFTGILNLQILPGLHVYHIVGTAICIPLLLWVLKAFAGG